MYSIVEAKGRDFALKGGKPGFITPKGWVEIDTKTFNKAELDRLTKDYVRRRGATQVQKDMEAHQRAKAEQEARRRSSVQTPSRPSTTPASAPPTQTKPPSSAEPPVATTKPPATTQKPTTPAPRPTQQPKIEKSPAGYAVGSLGGVKFERRAATRAELDAARAAREAAKKAGESKKQQELSAVKAAVSVSKNPMKEAFDVVLDYLFSEGHVDTLEEALYVMMEMSSETIQDIVEGDPSFQIKKSSGAGALTPDAAKQLGPKAIELQKKKAAEVDLPSIKQSPSSMVRGV